MAERPLIDPDVAVSGHLDLPADPVSVPRARRFVRQHLEGLPEDVVQDCALLTSELVSNVILHARTPVHLGISRDTDNVLVVVQDFSDRTTSQRADITPQGLAECGRGMAIVSSLADDFGWKRLSGEVGKIMWFAIGITERHPLGLPLQVDQAARERLQLDPRR
ncbi:MAG TPA: ATP-binding protein [Mycobacteriales bacterium]|nr:ATP-binding protein [Mycobacteriales bacterium]